MTTFSIECPHCNSTFRTASDPKGKSFDCPNCEKRFLHSPPLNQDESTTAVAATNGEYVTLSVTVLGLVSHVVIFLALLATVVGTVGVAMSPSGADIQKIAVIFGILSGGAVMSLLGLMGLALNKIAYGR
jgi:DNA-directed RNA polymerase subunit RPC12/RpoP